MIGWNPCREKLGGMWLDSIDFWDDYTGYILAQSLALAANQKKAWQNPFSGGSQ